MSGKERLMTADYVRSRLSYREDGRLIWKSKDGASKTKIGSVAGSVCKYRGYRSIRMKGHAWRENRLVWLIHNGEWPAGEVDHINGSRDDNRIENLRVVTFSQNQQNTGLPRNNTSGYRGVFFLPSKQRYRASIGYGGKRVILGDFVTLSEAASAYEAARAKYHGVYARKEDNHEQRL